MKELLLRNIPLFASIPPEDLAGLAADLHQAACPAGTTLIREGQRGNRVYIVLSGLFEIVKELGTLDERVFGLRGAGEFLGEMGLLNQVGLRTASARAVTDAQVLELTQSDFDRLLQRYPTIAYDMLRVLSSRLRDANDNVIHDLQEKNLQLQAQNQQLVQAYADLEAAQAQLVEKEALERELRLAREIQESLLPRRLPSAPAFELGARMVAARVVGGDFYDAFALADNSLGLVVGDVCGKGMPAALFMGLTLSLLRAEARRAASPELALRNLNQHLYEISNAGMFVTVLYGVLDCSTGEFAYARAGHELPLLWDSSGTPIALGRANGHPLGLLDEPAIDARSVRLPPGSMLLLFSDGVTEATDERGNFFDVERLQAIAREHVGAPAQLLCDRLVDALTAYRGAAPQADDITLLAARSLG